MFDNNTAFFLVDSKLGGFLAGLVLSTRESVCGNLTRLSEKVKTDVSLV